MMNQQQAKAVPYKSENEKPIHEYEILDNGDVKITQTLKSVSWWKSREFTSILREHEESLKNTENNLSEDFKNKLEEQKNDIITELNILRPLNEQSEKKAKIQYEKDRLEGLTKSLKQAIVTKEDMTGWYVNVWKRTKEEIKKDVLDQLTPEEMTFYVTMKTQMKRKNV